MFKEYPLKRYRKPLFIGLALYLLLVVAGNSINFSWKELVEGIPNSGMVIAMMFPPDFSAFGEMLKPALETIILAFMATVFGALLSVVFALGAAKNISHPIVRNTTRFLISVERALPEIFTILLLVAALGLGAFCGVVALAIGCIGMLGKLLADAIEEIDPKILESIEATGANKLQVIRFGVIPQIMPALISNTIFRFEVNIRLSVLLGAVGAGGIGYELFHSFNLLEYQRATTAIIVILALVFLSERLSDALRKKILGNTKGQFKESKEILFVPSVRFKKRLRIVSVTTVVLTVASVFLGFNPVLFFTDFHYLVDLAVEMIPDNLNILTKATIYKSIGQTVSMAFLGTLIGGTLAMLLAFLAANNTAPHAWVRHLVRGALALERVTPSMVIILIFITAMGIGPFAGMMALAIGTLGMFGKLFADALEHVETGPVEAISSVGAHKMQVIRYGMMPQVMPSFIANFFYAFDVNLRGAIMLGIFGGGGIGFEYYMVMKVLNYKDALALLLFTIILISLLEKMSDFFRKRIIGQEKLK
jgi:phosphonate transport system permease protein